MLRLKDRQRRHSRRALPRANRQRHSWRWLPLLVAAVAAFPAPAFAGTGGFAAPVPVATGASTSSSESLPSGNIAFGATRTAGATWYGPGFYGNRTACGQVLRPQTVGVAHRRLPCGTAVRFAYRGRYIVTTVIDRGPFTRGNVWDLTNGARQALGFAGSGLVRYAVALGYARD